MKKIENIKEADIRINGYTESGRRFFYFELSPREALLVDKINEIINTLNELQEKEGKK